MPNELTVTIPLEAYDSMREDLILSKVKLEDAYKKIEKLEITIAELIKKIKWIAQEHNYCPKCGAKMDAERKCNDDT